MASKIKRTTAIKSLKGKLKDYAFGYTLTETVSEYNKTEKDGLQLVKQKITEKTIPPDVNLIKLIYDLDGEQGDFANMTDDELEAELKKILCTLKDGENNGTKN